MLTSLLRISDFLEAADLSQICGKSDLRAINLKFDGNLVYFIALT